MYPQVFGKYVLERELSRGGMARVLLATLRGAGGFEKKLVVKQIRDELAFDQQFVRRFVEEAKTTVALSHPNIVPVYELGVEQGTYFLVMELVEGVSIADLLRERDERGRTRVLSPEEGAYIGVEVCRALDYAHRRMKVVHRDITPRNVMIDEEGQVKLIDFGIAAPALVAGHEILGSPGHMAPEQVDGGELGPPTDIFAVAVLLMEAWTGYAPFRRETPEACAAAVREPHPRPSDDDPRLLPIDGAIARAMSVDPRERQQEASELAKALRGFLQGVDTADVARALGDRVRLLREQGTPKPPGTRATPRPSRASHGELGTATFATREEASHWSSPPGPGEEERPSASTRRLDESPAAPRVVRAPTSRPDPAMSIPTPLMVDVGELEKIHGDIAAARAEKADKRREAPSAGKVETIATRPLETPVRAFETASPPVAPGKSSRRALFGVAAVLVVSGLVAWRMRGGTPADPTRVVATAFAPAGSTAPAPSASSVPAPLASASTRAPDAHSAAPPTSASVTAPSAAKAAVTFLGEPGTRVSVDGVARGECPVRLSLGEGAHDVRFTFDPTGESRGERFTVKAGDALTVRSDFTGATPTVKFQR